VNWKADGLEGSNCSWHVKGRRHQDPGLARHGSEKVAAVDCVLEGGCRAAVYDKSVRLAQTSIGKGDLGAARPTQDKGGIRKSLSEFKCGLDASDAAAQYDDAVDRGLIPEARRWNAALEGLGKPTDGAGMERRCEERTSSGG
jgi:hypothetical protein